VLGALRPPVGNQSDASLNHVRPGARNVAQEQRPLGSVEPLDVRLRGQFRATLNQAGGRWLTLAGSVPVGGNRSGYELLDTWPRMATGRASQAPGTLVISGSVILVGTVSCPLGWMTAPRAAAVGEITAAARLLMYVHQVNLRCTYTASKGADALKPIRTPGTIEAVPNQPRTQHRSVRVSDDDWADLDTAAKSAGVDRATLIKQFIRWYLRRLDAELPKRPESSVKDTQQATLSGDQH
jgi:hypothetical protein